MDTALQEQIARREAVLDLLKGILIEDLHIPADKDAIDLDVALFGTGIGLDSVDALELVVASETAFGVVFSEAALRTSLRTLNSLADAILELSAQGGPSGAQGERA